MCHNTSVHGIIWTKNYNLLISFTSKKEQNSRPETNRNLSTSTPKNSLLIDNYHTIPGIVGLWNYKTRTVMFFICVDDFGVKVWSKQDADNLCNPNGANFRHAVDIEGKKYCILTIYWYYELGHVDISMPKCVPATLNFFMEAKESASMFSSQTHTNTMRTKAAK